MNTFLFSVNSLAQVRSTVASLIGQNHGSYTDKNACHNRLLRATTASADASIAFLEAISKVSGLIYFQAYGTEGEGSSGSTFVVGGDAEFIKSLVRLQAPGVKLELY